MKRVTFFSFQAGTSPTTMPTVDENVIVTAALHTMRAEQSSNGRYALYVSGSTFAYRVTAETYLDFLNAMESDQGSFLHVRGPLSL